MDILAWLRQLGLQEYEQVFRDAEIGAGELPLLTADDLKTIGVTRIRHRWMILQAIADTMQHKDANFEYEKIKVLFDYTKFHIGLYATIGTLIVGIINVKLPGDVHLAFCPGPLWVGVLLIGIAGLAGGVVASTLPESASLHDFFRQKTGFWRIHLLTGRAWTRIEHTAFWMALISTILSFAAGQGCIICVWGFSLSLPDS